ncbi:pyruvate, phosphate dikinase [candidate division KSB3 bacterium]|uniref:Phosphoenolpyruvate synthase n=1 Tax=candidate division KSB3 bacterium TaxID=2044937 RepID=A0A2G6K9W0_9BACT|nr:MAG: pyruvate, phosphate dikinase [candidate division KSB3 bacterium]
MSEKKAVLSSGIPPLDDILRGIWAGDNVVFQVDELEVFLPFAHQYCRYANEAGKTLIYFRYAKHPPLLPEGVEAHCYHLHPQEGFEQFISQVIETIDKYGKGAYYLFDCLSGLAVDWYTDLMLANFFHLSCPYLYSYDTVTFFVLLRDSHRQYPINAIHKTAQVILDVFRRHEHVYIHPIKVFERYSPTMYMLHSCEPDVFRPVTKSTILSEILSQTTQPSIDFDNEHKDTWTTAFLQAQRLIHALPANPDLAVQVETLKRLLIKMIITRDDHLMELCEKYFDLPELVTIGKRMIGTGLIGGKSVGMLLARNIIKKGNHVFEQRLEPHDSFFIGSDVFYSYLVHNNCWWERHHLKNSEHFFEDAHKIESKLRHGTFPEDVTRQFQELLSYFGQSPLIVRSSSLLEDNYGNSFSGKYESVFCVNQGNPDERLANFLDAVQTIYASTMSQDALAYRQHRGLLNQDEQMALLVQRVSGEFYQQLYFPHIGGVGYSFNPFVWNPKIDPAQGMLRLVFGLGTRAVDRHDDDYTCVVAMNEPLLRPEGSSDAVRKYSQKIVNVLDLEQNDHVSYTFEHVVNAAKTVPLDFFASRDFEMESRAREFGVKNVFSYVLNFEQLLTKTSFVHDMKEIFTLLSQAYEHPVDIEFTVNFLNDTDYRIHLLQCRPFQFTGKLQHLRLPDNIHQENILFRTSGPIIGQSTAEHIDRIIYVTPFQYGNMPVTQRYDVARLIGKLVNLDGAEQRKTMLIGPGRWGTKMPELGIPVTFSEIQMASVLCEIAQMHEGLTPDLSLGTHFFNDIVEMDVVYMGISPTKAGSVFNEAFLKQQPNKLSQLLPDHSSYVGVIHVIDTDDMQGDTEILLYADTLEQYGVVFVSHDDSARNAYSEQG